MDSSKKTILIVDDYPFNLKLAELSLQSKYNVLTKESGIEALELLGSASVDLILLDIMMPKMDGFETYEKIREIEACKDTPVCFLTGADEDEYINKMAELNVPHIEKPFNPANLNEMISSLLQ